MSHFVLIPVAMRMHSHVCVFCLHFDFWIAGLAYILAVLKKILVKLSIALQTSLTTLVLDVFGV